MPRPLRILIARHGETEWNLIRQFQGHLDSPLTARGREQATRLAERLADEPIEAVFSSDLGRAIETATPVAMSHGLDLRTSPLLREINCGQWTGRAKDALAHEFPEASERYRLTPADHCMPGGESLIDVQRRGLKFLNELPRLLGQRASRPSSVERAPLKRPGVPGKEGTPALPGSQTIVVVTHHIVVETLLARALGLPLSELWLKIPAGNCFLSELELSGDNLRAMKVYDRAHLGTSAKPVFEGERVA